ncbi:hypothetical protein EDD15DRAFT_2439505 [Pisolithus albus]|nr:hypothetical protein EDD15DRAFT_2439505 [Pisolithus albus]
MSTVTYETALMFWRIITHVFVERLRPRSAFNIKIGLSYFHRTTSRPTTGFLARQTDSCIPVVRAMDEAKPGTGLVYLSTDDPCLLLGEKTRFKSEFASRMHIMMPKSVDSVVAEVLEVIADTELRFKREFGGEIGKGTALLVREKLAEIEADGKTGFPFKILPFIDQQEMYRGVHQRLKEGGSHDRTDLLPLKAGVSTMVLAAMANDPSVNVKIVPVAEGLVKMFKQGRSNKREAMSKLLDLIYDGLKTVTVRAPDYETLMLIQAARRLHKTPEQRPTLGQVGELNRHFLKDPGCKTRTRIDWTTELAISGVLIASIIELAGRDVLSRSTPASRFETPNVPEAEGYGDYNHVINFIPIYETASGEPSWLAGSLR